MIVDKTGTVLRPGALGKECMGNGEQVDSGGTVVECCCDECDYLICCTDINWEERCGICSDQRCPRSGRRTI